MDRNENREQRDAQAIQRSRPARQEKIAAHDPRSIRLQQQRISGKRERANSRSAKKELASCGGDNWQTEIVLRALTACSPSA
jgi:hypothetical protein